LSRRIVVTGAASGIGAATAAAFVAAGDHVIGLDRAGMAGLGEAVAIDLADAGAVERWVAELDQPIDVLVNAAGVPGTQTPQTVLAVNLLAPRRLTELLLSRLNPGGAVVHVSSGAGWAWRHEMETLLPLLALPDDALLAAAGARAPEGRRAYELSKALLSLHAVATAPRAQRMGLRVNAVAPGGVETPMLPAFRESMGADVLDWAAAAVGRHASPAEIADAIVFLASPAARWINGVELVADGGLVAGMLTGAWPAPSR
jgi:NAD(P)-dependent dehydrogenase (short-subunit alcohol dehydrogenase family)